METLEQKLTLVKEKIPQGIDDNSLFNILFEMNRYFDRQFVEEIHDKNLKLNQNKRNQLRKYYYYGTDSILEQIGLKIIMSIIERLKKHLTTEMRQIVNNGLIGIMKKERKIRSFLCLFLIIHKKTLCQILLIGSKIHKRIQ